MKVPYLIILVLISYYSFSQERNIPGYYLNKVGDTVKGIFPDYKQRSLNPKKINFISSQSHTQLTLTPLNCSEVFLTGYDIYFSYNGRRMTSPMEYNAALAQPDNKETFDTISAFIRQIAVTDAYKFYVYKDDVRTNLFYASKDNKIIELLQRMAIINNNAWESMTYKQQLKYLFPDGTKNEDPDKVSYSEAGITTFINNQNRRTKYFKRTTNENDGLLISAGASLNSLSFADKTAGYANGNYSSQIVPLAGVGYVNTLDRTHGKTFFYPQVHIYSYKFISNSTYQNSSVVINYSFKALPVVSLGLHVGYNVLNRGAIKAFIAPGAAVAFQFKNQYTEEFGNYINKATSTNIAYFINVPAGVILQKKYMIWLSYNSPARITKNGMNRGNLSSIKFGVGYKL